jgi:hypothetical protein
MRIVGLSCPDFNLDLVGFLSGEEKHLRAATEGLRQIASFDAHRTIENLMQYAWFVALLDTQHAVEPLMKCARFTDIAAEVHLLGAVPVGFRKLPLTAPTRVHPKGLRVASDFAEI